MVKLIDKLIFLYPDANVILFGVSTENGVQKIEGWEQPFPQLTQAELDSVTQSDVDGYQLEEAQTNNRVNLYQIHMGLKEMGQLEIVKLEYATLPTDDDIIILWSNDVDFARNGIFAMDMKSRFGLTDENLDNLWTKASAYKS